MVVSCASLCALRLAGKPVQGVTCLLPKDSWDMLQHTNDPCEDSGIENEWMDE